MEPLPLRSNFDLSPISSALPKPALLPLFSSRRISTSIRPHVSRKWSFYCASSLHTIKQTKPGPQSNAPDFFRSVGRGFIGFAAAAAALASLCCDSPAFAESVTVAFPVSRAREVTPPHLC